MRTAQAPHCNGVRIIWELIRRLEDNRKAPLVCGERINVFAELFKAIRDFVFLAFDETLAT